MGGREVGGLANLLSAHRDLANPQNRAEVAALWGVPSVPEKPGKTAVEMFQAAADGEIKALWIACTNPAQSMPDQATVRRALERAEFVVVQEAFSTTATCDYADLLLPATTWGEKDGTVTNSERRISRVRPAIGKPGSTRHDWEIAVEFARRLEKIIPPSPQPSPASGRGSLFPYPNPESIWNEHRETTRGRDLDITGLSYTKLDAAPQQWPMPEGAVQGKARLYEDNVFPTADGKAKFANVRYQPVAEPRDARYPFALTTGRLRDHWHGMSRTGTLGRLFGHVPEPVVQLHAQDMDRRSIRNGDLVHVTSRRGSLVLPAQASDEVALNQAFIAMHWGAEYLVGCTSTGDRVAGVNALTTGAFCPSSKQPELKHAAVKILKADLPWSLLAIAWLPDDRALSAREDLRRAVGVFPFASCVPFGHARTGVLLRAAGYEAPPEEIVARIEALLGLDAADALRYADKRKGQRRTVRLVRKGDEARLEAFLLAGDTSAQAWMKTLLEDELPAQSYGRALLAPGAKPPVAVASRGRAICTCFNVTDAQIQSCLAQAEGDEDQRLAQLQGKLQCGTNCGSCVPELKRMVRAAVVAQPQLSI
jgi:assimilatory nitrate reductase catalytic subunit